MSSDTGQPKDQGGSDIVTLGDETDRGVDVIILFISDKDMTSVRYVKRRTTLVKNNKLECTE